MSSDNALSQGDEGKTVVDQDGNTVGRVVSVDDGRAHVDPDPNVTDTIKSKLGWGDESQDTYALGADSIATVTDDEIRLGGM